MDIVETDLPGVGKKHEFELDDGGRLVIVTHNTGRRELYRKSGPDADSEKLFELSDRAARTVGTVLEGAYFQPVQSDRAETLLTENVHIEWYTVTEDSPLVGQTLAESELREQTGVSVVAIDRDDTVVAPPDPTERIEVGDVLVVIGDEAACDACAAFLSGTEE